MILNNVKIKGEDEPVSVRVGDGKIASISSFAMIDTSQPLQLTLDNAMIFPGLINSHDHLDFNLYKQLGDRTYSNYTEWGNHIHEAYKSEIDEVLKIPGSLRSAWGIYKNLLCGITTVVNHGENSGMNDDLITVFEDSQCLHSVRFEKLWRLKLNNPLGARRPVAIHVGEGDDWPSFNEIETLISWNLLQKKLVGIHAVAMSESQAKKFEAIVWCPQSNYFLLNKTAPVNLLKKHAVLLFGTDSTLTASWNIWDHLKLARKTKLVSDQILYETLNRNAAKTWKLNSGEIATGRNADLVVATMNPNKSGLEAFFETDPSRLLLVMHKGSINLFDESLVPQLKSLNLKDFSEVHVNGACKYVKGDLHGLMKKIRAYHPAVEFPVNVN